MIIRLDEEWSTYKKLLFFQAMGGGALSEYEVTGNPVAFNTNVAKPFSAFTIPFLPVQSGTGDPSPDNVRPISGWTGVTAYLSPTDESDPDKQTFSVTFPALGKNLFDKSTPIQYGQYYSNGSWLSGDNRICTDYVPVEEGETYTFSVPTDNAANLRFINYNLFNEDKVWLGDRTKNGESTSFNGQASHTFTVNLDGAKYVRLVLRDKSDSETDISNRDLQNADLQLEKGSSVTAYEPYTNTVYGGTLDAVNGVLTVDTVLFAFKDLVALNGASANWMYNSTYNLFETQNAIIPTGTANTETGIVCSCYQSRPYGYNNSYSSENSIVWAHTSGTLRIKDNRYTDVDVWKTAIADEQIVIPLATPYEIQLDTITVQTLIGDNTIWTDTNGENTVKYLKKG